MLDLDGKRVVWVKIRDLIAVVGPGGPFHLATLQVEGEEFDVDVARTAEDAVTEPHHFARARYDHVGVDHRRAVLSIGTVNTHNNYCLTLSTEHYALYLFTFNAYFLFIN